MNIKTTRLIIILSFFLLFFAFFYNYLSINLWDYDFWWHVSTGRYIVETGSIPEKDPFSFTSEFEENRNLFPDRETFILKQYWLSQVIFYLTYSTFGARGIIILKSLILFLVVLSVFFGLKRNGVHFFISFNIVFLVYMTTIEFNGERPVLFTILFSVVVFLIIDEYMRNKGRSIFLLVPVMLLWANLHGGFIIGNILIMVYMFSTGLNIITKNSAYAKRDITVFYSAATLALVSSYINPAGWYAFYITLSPEYKSFASGIQEHMPVFKLYKENLRPLDAGYISMILMFPFVLILRARKMAIAHILLLSGLLFMSITALRFIIYYVLVGAIILGKEINLIFESEIERNFSETKRRWLTNTCTVIILLVSLVYFIRVIDFNKGLEFGHATNRSAPELAVDFIEKNRLSGNIYNAFELGGYITWRLYPWKKIFVDTRWLNAIVSTEAKWIILAKESIENKELPGSKIPLWERLLDHYDIEVILLNTLGVMGTVPPLVLELIKHDRWIPVHVDNISVLFVRNVENNREVIEKYRLQNGIVYNSVIKNITQMASANRRNPEHVISLGDVYYSMGRMHEALSAYESVKKRLSKNNPVRGRIESRIQELESKN